MKKDIFLLLGLMGMFSCSNHTDLYNPDNEIEQKQEEYDKNFPVKDIDPNQDWNTFTSVKVKVTVNEDLGESYIVKLYTANPLDENPEALLLAKGEIRNGETYSEEVQLPLSITNIWVARIDSHNRRLVKLVAVKDGSMECSFGGGTVGKSISRAIGDNGITMIEEPYTSKQIQELLNGAASLSNGLALQAGGVYKVTDKFVGTFSHAGAGLNNQISSVKLLVWGEGAELTLIDRINAGLEVIVGNGGKVLLPENRCEFVQTAQLTVLNGGTVFGSSSTALIFSNGSTNINAGVLEVGELNNNGGTLYNNGKMHLTKLLGPSTNSQLINNGEFTANDIEGAGVDIETGCLLKVTNSITVNTLKIGTNAAVETQDMHLNGVLTLMPTSLLTVSNEFRLNNGTIMGPLSASSTEKYADYGFLKIRNLAYWSFTPGQNGYMAGYIVADIDSYDSNAKWGFENAGIGNDYTPSEYKENKEILCTKAYEAPIVIPEGDCTGGGYTPVPDGGDNGDNDKINSAIYAFEDLGSIGDYDFNDVVVEVEHQAGNTTAMVRLLAVGGTLPVKVKYGNTILWEEVHAAFDVEMNTMVNTGTTKKEIPLAKEIEVSGNIAFSDINISVEVTLSSDGETTSQIAKITSPEKGKAPQRLCLPGYWKWPKERVSIIDAYGKEEHAFGDWAGDVAQAVDWFDNPVEGKVYTR